jgi:transcription elongation GreA/GreB family factor
MDKRYLVEQLTERLRATARIARRAVEGASESLDDTGVPELQRLLTFHPRPYPKSAAVDLGAVVEVEGDEGGRTLFLAPTGEGEELSGPDGDGFLSVITPETPLGKAVLGRHVGEALELTSEDPSQSGSWRITFVA